MVQTGKKRHGTERRYAGRAGEKVEKSVDVPVTVLNQRGRFTIENKRARARDAEPGVVRIGERGSSAIYTEMETDVCS